VNNALELRVLQHIRRTRLIAPGDRVAVGVSGGADSVALFRLLLDLRDALGVTLLAVHFHHCLRGAESDADADFVKSLAREHGLEFVCERADVAAFAREQRLNLEDAARRLRYGFFERVVAEGRATRVAVAHTADDQAETVLARLVRGTGPSGLAGIYPTMGAVIRPLLGYRREELRGYLRGMGQEWREDRSNKDVTRQRAKIRAQLLPVLEREFSPAIVERLGQLARLAREEHEFWETLVESRFAALARETQGRVRISILDLLAPLGLDGSATAVREVTERPVTERLVRRLYKGIRGDCRELAAVHVEQVLALVSEGASGQRVDLPGGVQVARNFGELIFSARAVPGTRTHFGETKSTACAYHYAVKVPNSGTATVCVPELGTRLLVKVIDWSRRERDTKRDDALDADLLPATLTLRNWQPGDAYRPRGHRQPRKLKQLFVSRRVPRSERGCWPVMEWGGRIVWVRGMPAAAEFCVGEKTRSGVVIEEAKI
jgi:tRNA(Ile)-lysidine synthase